MLLLYPKSRWRGIAPPTTQFAPAGRKPSQSFYLS